MDLFRIIAALLMINNNIFVLCKVGGLPPGGGKIPMDLSSVNKITQILKDGGKKMTESSKEAL